jgi:AraC family transcriptional regulator
MRPQAAQRAERERTARRRFAVGEVHAELLPRAPYETAYTPTTAVIGFAFETQTGIHAFASDRASAFRTRPNSLAYVPAGCDVMSRSERGGEYLTVRLGGPEGSRPPLDKRFSDHVEPAAIVASQTLRRMLLAREPVDPLLFEAEAAKLRIIAERVLGGPAPAATDTRWMTARRLRAIDELIEARLDTPLTVGELASSLKLSRGFFARAFKAAIGKAPHDYIIDRRLSRARLLLQTSDGDLANIALTCGFSSHAHMTALFRRRLGIVPQDLRR